ncbi:MAG TPA: type II toxin-antitoxin system VapC family toxin [Aliidongia sp.]|uniref:type II toxin-antitoxin system VapC family toxin n=1 Tax=Aliidongia sp. TaxID=1914230 RepID=UPI002DDCBC52|nr:type II toxin-antitoxin system VapC family toxin [Aliidongia sp.]HEV2676045.1 type II toxin-antitoxin system VapC family toxin [Aliidongia sp.]
MRYLLDTNIISDLVRNPAGRIAQQIELIGEAQVCTSIIVASELRYGTTRKASPKLMAQLEIVLSGFEILPLEAPADAIYGAIRTQLERSGTPVGGNDMFIAAHAMALGYTVVTDNEREFSRIEGLNHENWLRPD